MTSLPLRYDESTGQLYYEVSGTYVALTGYTWNGTIISAMGMALTQTAAGSGGTTSYLSLPASADGTWSLAGSPIFTISDSQIDYAGMTSLPLRYDESTGQLYYEVSGTYVALTGYTWNGTIISAMGMALTQTAAGSGGTTSYLSLPASADGTWSLAGSPIFTISDSQIDYAGMTSLPLRYDESTGQLYYEVSGTYVALTGYTWNGTIISAMGMDLTQTTDIPATTYAVTVSPSGEASGESISADVSEAAEGAAVTLTAVLNSGRQVALSASGVTISPDTISSDGGTATFTMPDAAVEVTATFVDYDELSSETPVSGIISGFKIMSADKSPYSIDGNVLIAEDSILVIEPGVQIIFEGMHYLRVDGILVANGTETDRIVFTSRDESWHSQWEDIRVNNALSQLSFCTIKHATVGIYLDGNLQDDFVLKNIQVEHVERGFYLNETEVHVTFIDCIVRDGTKSINHDSFCFYNTKGDISLYNCQILNHGALYAWNHSSSKKIILNNVVVRESRGIFLIGGEEINIYNSLFENNFYGVSSGASTINISYSTFDNNGNTRL
jgi:hypothetical protein